MTRRLFFFLSFFASCAADDGPPKDVLPAPRMVALLHDVVMVDETIDFLSMQDSTYQKSAKRLALYDSVFQLHRTGKKAYKRSLAFYQERPDLLKLILDSVYQRLDTTRLRPPASSASPKAM